MYLQRGDLERARAELQEAIRLEPKFALAHFNLALVFQKEAKIEEAEGELRAALRADPSFPAARAELDRLEATARQ